MLKPISSLSPAEAAGMNPWQATGPWASVVLAKHPYGVITHGVVCQADGSPLFDLPLWWERVGAICLTIDEQDRFVLVRQLRPAATPPGRPMPYPAISYDDCGAASLEFPRGYVHDGESGEAAAAREAEEETGCRCLGVEALAWTNANTSYFPYSHRVFVVRLDSRQATQRTPDATEQIQDVVFLSRSELLTCVATGEVFCGLTKSALLSYLATQMA